MEHHTRMSMYTALDMTRRGSKRSVRLCRALVILSALAPVVGQAQGLTTEIGVTGSALQSAPRLGGGSMTGVGPTLLLPLGTWTSLETSVLWYSHGILETDGTQPSQPGGSQPFHLLLPSTTLRATVIEGRTALSALLGAGVMRYRFGAGDTVPDHIQLVPTVDVGLALRMRIGDRIAATFSGRDWLSYVRANELNAPTGGRGFGHSVDFRMSVMVLFGRRNVTMTRIADFPLTYAPDFRPISASATREDPTKTDDGRTHLHANNGDTVSLAVVPSRVFTGQQVPGSVSRLVATRPAVDYDESILGNIYFGTDSSTLLGSYRTVLETITQYLHDHPAAMLELRAYTDGIGPQHENVALSERRATAVKELLVRLYGIDPDRITTIAMGVDFKALTDASARRVEIGVRTPRLPGSGVTSQVGGGAHNGGTTPGRQPAPATIP